MFYQDRKIATLHCICMQSNCKTPAPLQFLALATASKEVFLMKCTALPFHGMPSKQKRFLCLTPGLGFLGNRSYLTTLPAYQQHLFGEACSPLLSHSKSKSAIFFFTWKCFCGARFLFYFLFLVNIHLTLLSNVFSCNHLKDFIQTIICFLFFPFCITLKGHISWPNSCGEWISSFAEVLLQPKPDLLKVVEKGAFAPQVGNFLSLHNAYSLKWNPVGHIGIVVHAVSHHLALRWQGKVLKELVSSCTSLFLAFVFLNFEWRGRDSRCSPAIWWVSFIDVDQQKVSHTRELLHQLAEGWQLACERGSGSWAKVDHQWPLWVGKIQ